MSRPIAYLFDLDGTLVDSAPDIALCLNEVLKQNDLPLVEPALVATWIGTGSPGLIASTLQHLEISTDSNDDVGAPGAAPRQVCAEQLLKDFAAQYAAHPVRASALYPDAIETLQALRSRGARLGVVTNKLSAVTAQVLAHFKLTALLDVVIGGDDVKPNKPAPAPLLAACEQLGVAPGQCLMVGDSRNDIRAARAAGMPVVALPYGYNHGEPIESANPDRVIDSLSALL